MEITWRRKITPARVEDSIKGLTFCVNVTQSENLKPIVPHVDDDGGMLYAASIYTSIRMKNVQKTHHFIP